MSQDILTVSNTEPLNKAEKQVKYKHREMHTYFKDEVFSYLLHIQWTVIKYVQLTANIFTFP
jgi:hypothetical protein